MDLNGDGRDDILTGSYNPGHLYLFPRNEDGTFGEGERLKYADGSLIEHVAGTPFAVDWDGDGDLDLLCGDIRGHAWFIEKTDKGYAQGVKLSADGKELKAEHGDSQPVAADWNGDGVLDLVFPHGNGKVEVYPGEMTDDGIKLGSPTTLVEAFDRNAEGVRPGSRAKVCVTDVNGDGALDLMLGDYETIRLPAPELTDEEKAEFEKLKKVQQEYSSEVREIAVKIQKKELEKYGKELNELTDEERKEFTQSYITALRGNEDYLEASRKNRELAQKMRKYRGGFERRGNVWLFTRKVEEKSPVTGKAEG